MKYFIIVLSFVLLLVGGYLLLKTDSFTFTKDGSDNDPLFEDEEQDDLATSSEEEVNDEDESDESTESEPEEVIGKSVLGRDIKAYHFGEGDKEIILVGGIHGGYSWNTALLSYSLIDKFESDEEIIPEGVKVTVIPVLNPDGLFKVTGKEGEFESSDVSGDTTPARFNQNNVDLNRNFDCNWESTSMWRNTEVDAGSSSFSEPESKAFRDYVQNVNPVAVVVYYSSGGGVYASSCNGGASSETLSLMNTYADASGYQAEGLFDSYKITGDAVDWLAKINVPAVSVILDTPNSTDWSKNYNGIQAVLDQFAN